MRKKSIWVMLCSSLIMLCMSVGCAADKGDVSDGVSEEYEEELEEEEEDDDDEWEEEEEENDPVLDEIIAKYPALELWANCEDIDYVIVQNRWDIVKEYKKGGGPEALDEYMNLSWYKDRDLKANNYHSIIRTPGFTETTLLKAMLLYENEMDNISDEETKEALETISAHLDCSTDELLTWTEYEYIEWFYTMVSEGEMDNIVKAAQFILYNEEKWLTEDNKYILEKAEELLDY